MASGKKAPALSAKMSFLGHFCRPKGAKRLPAGEARSALAGPFDYTVYPLCIDEPMVDSTQPKWKIPGVMNVKIAVKL